MSGALQDVKALIIIPARGGSVSVKNKNLQMVGGIPLVGRAAIVSNSVKQHLSPNSLVICSTDSEDIAHCAREWGAEVPYMRPASLSCSESSDVDVILHALQELGQTWDCVVQVHGTVPFLAEEDILGAISYFTENEKKYSVLSVNECEPVGWCCTVEGESKTLAFPTHVPLRRQEVMQTYRLNGGVYVSSPSIIIKDNTFLGAGAQGYVMPKERSIDIDTQHDLLLAQNLAEITSEATSCIENRMVGHGLPAYVIAEAGVNHNQSMSLAKQLVDAAKNAGADAVKFQSFSADDLVTEEADKADYQKKWTGTTESHMTMLKNLELTHQEQRELFDYCDRKGITFLSTPYDCENVDFLDKLGVQAFKLASAEVTNFPLLRHVASKKKTIILSTGMATLAEVQGAVRVLDLCGFPRKMLILLQCVSCYPAPSAAINLKAMDTLSAAFGTRVGYSDHTDGIYVSVAAVARGACVVEKHFTLDKELPGPDHKASLSPDELCTYVAALREIEACMGNGHKIPGEDESSTRATMRRSLALKCDMKCGTVLTAADLICLRPASGICPSRVDDVVGRRLSRFVPGKTMLSYDDFQ
mmetsp:Transcript_25335/g.80168  ORF Transcript_25335/g.80168 Transcript_25335/m.80168 type:complete len:587 (+) Transcript_25335:340-2100(+)|eukprot:CAMPEP_0182864522 /NCGR_PEP_ID=MMETSP0034_2-20130328/7211_1 /TAXON_ID=156128 /ORGANISM="Nephroselmis pyriformis, Strain CCMP717" /LENGTH=586 /DNA_ID=CAMNT_0024996781 /DNA_START=299 /DNA_END=2059 /DNA_ORIENTATION=-